MKKMIAVLAAALLLAGCSAKDTETTTGATESTAPSVETTLATTEATEETTESTAVEETEDTLIRFTVYAPDEAWEHFVATEVEGENLSVLEELIRVGVLNEDVEILSVAWEDTHATVDMNGAFRDLVCTMGSTGEKMIMGSVVNTFLSAYQVETVTITVEGDVWESGHVVYDFPMSFFE